MSKQTELLYMCRAKQKEKLKALYEVYGDRINNVDFLSYLFDSLFFRAKEIKQDLYTNLNAVLSIMAERNMIVKHKIHGSGGVFYSMPMKDVIIAARKMCKK